MRKRTTKHHKKFASSVWEQNAVDLYSGNSTVFALRTAHKRYITALHSSPNAPLKKIKTFHLYTTAGAHYNTIKPCQSNFVRVNRPGGSMRSGLYKYLKLDQSQSEDIRLRNKVVVCPFLFLELQRTQKQTVIRPISCL